MHRNTYSKYRNNNVSNNDVNGFRKRNQVQFYKKRTSNKDVESKEIQKLVRGIEQFDPSTAEKFNDFPLSNKTKLGLKKGGYFDPTEIQRDSLGLGLKGCDVLGAAKTGSGKTLAFLVPLLEKLYRERWSYVDGLGALVITPTRELAYQIFEVLNIIGCYHDFSAGLIIGGKDLKFERERMDKCNIVICTPGRLLQHMDENPLFECGNLRVLVLDEADRILDLGFQQTMNAIIENLSPNRQTLLFSATQTKSVKDLARLSLKDPEYVSVHEHAKYSTPEALQQSYMVCELHEKMDTLWSFIRSHRKQKILVFLASCKQVKYTYEVFCRMRPGMSILALYGTLHQLRRMAIYDDFCNKQTAVLLATDIASRGLDFPSVHWVVHLDCPEDVNTYIHRAGRTARNERDGESLLVLLPSEEKAMTDQLEGRKIPLKKTHMSQLKYVSVQRKMEALCARDVNLKESAQRAFVAYLKSVFLMKDKSVFAIQKLDIESYARSLGLALAPRVRFLQKHLAAKKALQQQKNKESPEIGSQAETELEKGDNTEKKPDQKLPYQFQATIENHEDSSDGDNDFLTLKRVIMPSEDNRDSNSEDGQDYLTLNARDMKSKVISKASVVKKMLKKNIKANKKIVFDEEGVELDGFPTEQKSEIARDLIKKAEQLDENGLNFDIAKQIMEEEDKIDKKIFMKRIRALHKERKKKMKAWREEKDERRGRKRHPESEGSEEDDYELSAFINELPDPDNISSDKRGSRLRDSNNEGARVNQFTKRLKQQEQEPVSQDVKNGRPKKKLKIKKKVMPDIELSMQGDEELVLHILTIGK